MTPDATSPARSPAMRCPACRGAQLDAVRVLGQATGDLRCRDCGFTAQRESAAWRLHRLANREPGAGVPPAP